MSDSIEHQEVSTPGRSDKSLLSGEWPASDPVETGVVQPKQTSFEGASSLVELPNSATDDGRALDSASEQNLRKLLKDVERLRKASRPLTEERIAAESPYVERYLERARAHYANQDFKKSLEILHDGLKLVPGNPDILALAEEVRSESERRQAEMEESGLADRIAQCKAEAIRLFEQGRYGECIERFKVLTELEPTNTDLRDYLEVSREQTEKVQPVQVTPPVTETVESQEVQVSSSDSQMPEPAEPEASRPEPVYLPVEIQNVVQVDLPKRHSIRLFEPGQEAAPPSSVAEKSAHDKGMAQEYPVAVQLQQLRLKAQEEDRKQSEREEADDSDLLEDPAQAGRKKLTIACLAGVGLVIGAMIGAWLALAPGKVGRVPTDDIAAPVANSQPAADAAQPPAVSAEPPLEDPQAKAEKAFKQGRLWEANRFCEMLLQSAPDNAFALDLKQQIRARYVKIAEQASARQNWTEASIAWHNLLRVVPGDREAARQLKASKANLKQEEQLALSNKLELEKRIEDLHQEIRQAMKSGRHLPPSTGNAFDSIQKLEGLAPEDAFAQEQRNEILRHLSASAARSLQAKDTLRASALIRQMESYFPEATELKSLRDGLKAEQLRLADARNSWMQKAEAAMTAGHFVTPVSDNAIAYCHELLVLDPQNAKALALKKESIARAAAQAQMWTQESRYDEAKAVYSALLYLQQAENQTQLSSQQIKAEIEKLTFNAYAVIHDHALGSCSGRLRFNGYQIAYIPSSNSKDGFSANITEVSQVESDDKLKIQLKGKSYRFQINGLKDSQEIRTRIGEIQRQLSALVASK